MDIFYMFDDNKSNSADKLRILFAIVLSMGVIFFWTFFYDAPTSKPPTPSQSSSSAAESSQTPSDSSSANSTSVSQDSKPSTSDSKSITVNQDDFKEEEISLNSKNLSVKISTLGGVVVESIVRYNIINHEEPINSENQEGKRYPGFETGNIVFKKPNLEVPEKAFYQVIKKSKDSLELAAQVILDGRPVTVIKNFSIEDYRLNMQVRFEGVNKVDYYLINGSGLSSVKSKNDVYNVVNLSYNHVDSLSTPLSKGITSFFTSTPEIVWISPPFDWISIDDRFFARVLEPKKNSTIEEVEQSFFMEKNIDDEVYHISGLSSEYNNQPHDFTFYYFPKSRNLLDNFYDKDKQYFFNLFHQFKFMRIISSMMYWVIETINGWVKSYGVAIIIMTILLKLAVFPLQQKSMRSMQKMQEYSPKIKAIRDNYKNKPQKMNQELMAFYKKEGINPLGGCLPMLIPLPIFIALYSLFQSMVELKGIPFLWADDLSLPDVLFRFSFELPFLGTDFHLLPIIVVITSLLQSIFSPQAAMTTENRQQMIIMKYMMPFFFFFISWKMPSALILYWTIQNLFTVGQTLLLKRSSVKKQTT